MSGLSIEDKLLIKELNKKPANDVKEEIKQVSTPDRKKLGEILEEKGIITSITVERILPLCTKSKKRFGTILEEIGLITSEELAQALAIQHGCKIVADFAKYQFSHDILKLVPMETAVEHILFPLKVQNNVLALAVFDPTNEKVISNLKENTGMQIRPFIATRKDINKAIAKYYLNNDISDKDDNTILIVEDDKLILTILTNMLNKEGYNIITACDGMEAYKAIVINKPKLVLTDKEMPKFNGYALLDSLKNIPETNRIPVILISGSNDPDEEAAAYEKGFFDYISKPVRETTLKAKVKRALKSHRHLISFHS